MTDPKPQKVEATLNTPEELNTILCGLVENRLMAATMIWGPPGIGKSSLVSQVAKKYGMELIDLRISQLAPTDLRGLPVPKDGQSRWLPPSFLPRGPVSPKPKDRRFRVQDVKGILFLDEFNMAPPVVQGIAQQLVLDRRVGDYIVPDGWFIWAAGNRKSEDRAAVNDMPAPLGNRFLHLFIRPDLPSFRAYMIQNKFPEDIILFIEQFPELMHKISKGEPAWPSPRTWEVASRLYSKGLPIGSAVGEDVEPIFNSFVEMKDSLSINGVPVTRMIMEGRGSEVYFTDPDTKARSAFPTRRDVAYIIVRSLAILPEDGAEAINGAKWIITAGSESLEYITIWANLIHSVMKSKPKLMATLMKELVKNKEIMNVFREIGRAKTPGQI